MIGIPILNYSHDFVTSFLKFWTQICNMPEKDGKRPVQVGYQFMYRKPVHLAEIELVKIAQWNKCTHILLMDDDIYDITVTDMQKLIDADKDVISGVMYASGFPYSMCVFRRYDTNKKVIDQPADNTMCRLYEVPCTCPKCGFGLSHWDVKFCPICGAVTDNMIQKADLVPFPFTLIKMSVFDKIKKPWFHCTDGYPTDSWFCDRCHEAGIGVYGHMGVRLNHNGVNDLTRPYLTEMGLAKKRSLGEAGGLINVSPEEMNKHQFILNNKMREAEDRLKTKLEFVGDVQQEAVVNKEEEDDSTSESVSSDVQEEKSVEVSS
jgi:hypothetical protein